MSPKHNIITGNQFNQLTRRYKRGSNKPHQLVINFVMNGLCVTSTRVMRRCGCQSTVRAFLCLGMYWIVICQILNNCRIPDSLIASCWRRWLIVVYTAQSPRYLSAQLTRVADIPSRLRLRSSATDAFLVRPTQLVTVGDRAFPVAAAKLWNELVGDFTASQSLAAFRRQLKTFLFHLTYPVL